MSFIVLKTLPSVKVTLTNEGKSCEQIIDLQVYAGSSGVVPLFENRSDALSAAGGDHKLVYEVF